MELKFYLHAPAVFPPKKKYVPIPTEQEAVWAAELVWPLWRRRKPLVLPGIEQGCSWCLAHGIVSCSINIFFI